jgi:hypothetical protein
MHWLDGFDEKGSAKGNGAPCFERYPLFTISQLNLIRLRVPERPVNFRILFLEHEIRTNHEHPKYDCSQDPLVKVLIWKHQK